MVIRNKNKALSLDLNEFLEFYEDFHDYLNLLHFLYFEKNEILKENIHKEYLSPKMFE